MLGKDKEHLYPKIFQLVIADAAFTEGMCCIDLTIHIVVN
jgi:hypothetical protein